MRDRARDADSTAPGEIVGLGPGERELRDAVLAGLSTAQKQIPCKFLYDDRGAELFEAICDVDEYYPTRTEIGLLARHCDEIAAALEPGLAIVDLGSGSARKLDELLAGLCRPAAYAPIDICRESLRAAAHRAASRHPGLHVVPVCADYTEPLELPDVFPEAPRLLFFPGSTIGNFRPGEARRFLSRLGELAGPRGALLIGVDTTKDPQILEAAYDDRKGVTAAFNLNVLARLNRELGADFDLGAFSHRAVYNAARACVEMHLVSKRAQRARVAGASFSFREGETIHTENSFKYAPRHFARLARAAGWAPARCFIDDQGLFSVHLLRFAERAAPS